MLVVEDDTRLAEVHMVSLRWRDLMVSSSATSSRAMNALEPDRCVIRRAAAGSSSRQSGSFSEEQNRSGDSHPAVRMGWRNLHTR